MVFVPLTSEYVDLGGVPIIAETAFLLYQGISANVKDLQSIVLITHEINSINFRKLWHGLLGNITVMSAGKKTNRS